MGELENRILQQIKKIENEMGVLKEIVRQVRMNKIDDTDELLKRGVKE